nr:MAG TPA: hypothetical protein [Herelleviridae sp.]
MLYSLDFTELDMVPHKLKLSVIICVGKFYPMLDGVFNPTLHRHQNLVRISIDSMYSDTTCVEQGVHANDVVLALALAAFHVISPHVPL